MKNIPVNSRLGLNQKLFLMNFGLSHILWKKLFWSERLCNWPMFRPAFRWESLFEMRPNLCSTNADEDRVNGQAPNAKGTLLRSVSETRASLVDTNDAYCRNKTIVSHSPSRSHLCNHQPFVFPVPGVGTEGNPVRHLSSTLLLALCIH